ncbi:MAG: 3-oxoacyl-ACP reductase FabG [Dehalococcoidales bacterium]|nr:3-oxoacyl-ACP reductase FabG [Dehalococcoidales bacterium]
MLAQFDLKGKVALVTGGSRGLGKAIALTFAKAGADVAVASRKLPDLEKVVKEIESLGKRALAVELHVGRIEQRERIEKVVKEFGRIDILVNNAGTGLLHTTLMELEEKAWDVIMNLNLKGLFFLSQAVAKEMKKQGGGRIINIASTDAYWPDTRAGGGAYGISKAGVVMATKAMARDWAQYNIRVNAVAPGPIHTSQLESRFAVAPEDKKSTLERLPMGHIGEPEEIANVVLFLASDASSYVVGETVVVDGGTLLY